MGRDLVVVSLSLWWSLWTGGLGFVCDWSGCMSEMSRGSGFGYSGWWRIRTSGGVPGRDSG